MRLPDQFVRNIWLGSLLETFLVASITAILVIRFFLAATGYPQIGGGGLHISHMLWGGLLMLVAIVLMLVFLGRRIQFAAALLGGIGFGTFIDELGKFITSDNNYFFQPTIALIYIIFIALLLSFRILERNLSFSVQERLANALALLQEAVLHGMHEENKAKILLLLNAENSSDFRLHLLADMVEHMPVSAKPKPGILEKITSTIRNLYLRLVRSRQFATIMIIFFIGYALLFTLFAVLNTGTLVVSLTKGFVQTCLLASAILSSIMIVIGVLFLRRSRLRACYWFRRAVLVSIFLTQVFMFYRQQLGALDELAVNVTLLVALNYLIHNLRRKMQDIRVVPERSEQLMQ